MSTLGTNDVRLFPVPAACSLNPADVVLSNPRAPCDVPFFDVVLPAVHTRAQPQQSILAFVYVTPPVPPTPTRRRSRPLGGGGMSPLPLRFYQIEEPAPPVEDGARRVVAQAVTKRLETSVDKKRAEAPAEEKRVTAVPNPRKIPRRR